MIRPQRGLAVKARESRRLISRRSSRHFPGESVTEGDGQPRQIAAEPVETRHEPGANWVCCDKDNRNRRRDGFRREAALRTERHQNVHLESDQVGDQPMEMFTPSFRPSVLNGQALLFNIPKLSQSGKEVTAERARPSRDVVAPKGSRSAGQPGSVRPPPTRPEHEGGDSQARSPYVPERGLRPGSTPLVRAGLGTSLSSRGCTRRAGPRRTVAGALLAGAGQLAVDRMRGRELVSGRGGAGRSRRYAAATR